MSQKQHTDEGILQILRRDEANLVSGSDVVTACRTSGISDGTFYICLESFGDMGRSKMANVKALCKENDRLKTIVAELELDKLILKETLDYLNLKA